MATIDRIEAKVIEQAAEQQSIIAEIAHEVSRIEGLLGLPPQPQKPPLEVIQGGRDDA